MQMKIWCLYMSIFLSVALVACDDDDPFSEGNGQLIIEFDNRVGDENLELFKDYVNAEGETFQLTKLNYYISNISLRTDDGHEFVVPQDSSYFLIMEDDETSQHIHLRDIPPGNYNQIKFTIGVDSLRSTMDVSKRHGVLDPAQGHDGMYWTWNSGYIFFKMEGISPAAPLEQDNKFYYHIGGYGGYESPGINNIRERTLNMGSAVAQVRPEKNPQVHLHVDVQEFFRNPTDISIADHSLVMFSDYSTTVSGNYVNMFQYHHVHN